MSEDLDRNLTREQALALVDCSLEELLRAAARRRDAAHGSIVSYSRKVFIPLTQLCRDVCHYCTFAHPPRKNERAYLSLEDVLAIAQRGFGRRLQGSFVHARRSSRSCATEPPRDELARLGHPTTLSYLAQAARAVHDATGLLPHLNPGHLTPADVTALRGVSVSQGLMLEIGIGAAVRARRPAPRFARQASARAAREHPRRRRAARAVHLGHPDRHRRNARGADRFAARPARAPRRLRPYPGNHHPEFPAESRNPHGRVRRRSSLEEHLWTIAIARLLFAPSMNIQAPPNLSPDVLPRLIEAGINDWGGVSPVTPDHVNPEAPWPAAGRARARHRGGRQAIWSSGWRSIRPLRATPIVGSIRRCALRSWAASTPTAGRAAMTGVPARAPRFPTHAARVGGPADRRRTPRHLGESTGRRQRWAKTTSCGCFAAAARSFRPCARRPTSCAERRMATSSPTSSPATSITPTSVTSNAASAPSPKASSARICAVGPTTSRREEVARRVARGVGARGHRSLHAGRHSSKL